MPFKVGSEKSPKYGKVLYQHYFQYISCVNLFIIKIYIIKTRLYSKFNKLLCVWSEAFYFISFLCVCVKIISV